MSSTGQSHSTVNDVQKTTNDHDATVATGSLATAVDHRFSKYLDFTLTNCEEYTCPADVYKRFRNNKVEQEQFKLGPWELISHTMSDVQNAYLERHFTDFDTQGFPHTLSQTVKNRQGGVNRGYRWVTDENHITISLKDYPTIDPFKYSDLSTQYTCPADAYGQGPFRGRGMIYRTKSQVLDATIERHFEDLDGQGFPNKMVQNVKEGKSYLCGDTWAGEDIEHNESESIDRFKLQCPWAEPKVKVVYRGGEPHVNVSYNVCLTQAGQSEQRPEAAPARVHELAQTWVKRMVQARQQRVSSTWGA